MGSYLIPKKFSNLLKCVLTCLGEEQYITQIQITRGDNKDQIKLPSNSIERNRCLDKRDFPDKVVVAEAQSNTLGQ
jgi:hypothetical protein